MESFADEGDSPHLSPNSEVGVPSATSFQLSQMDSLSHIDFAPILRKTSPNSTLFELWGFSALLVDAVAAAVSS